jgi:hypothetical protein
LINEDKMPEAEVSLRLALFLIRNRLVEKEVKVSLDGAHIKTGNTVHFHIREFLRENNCIKLDREDSWLGTYEVDNHSLSIVSIPGEADVVARLTNGSRLRVESKKGSLKNSSGSKEYPLLREAIGQLVTINSYNDIDRLAVAVPYSPKFKALAERWSDAPLIRKLKLDFLLIHRNGEVEGFNHSMK